MATKKVKASKKTAPSKTRTAVRRPAKPGAVAAPVATAPVAAPAAKAKGGAWIQIALAAVVLLVSVEVFLVLKGKIDRQGELKMVRNIGERGGPPDKPGQFWGPGNIRVDRERNRVAMVDGNFNKIIFYNTRDGALLAEVNKHGKHVVPAGGVVPPGDFLPINGAFDGEGNFYAVDQQHGEVTVIGLDYRVKGTWKVNQPGEIAADTLGNIYIVDKTTNDIVRYDAQGKEQARFGSEKLSEPGFLAADNGKVYAVDRGRLRVQIFTANGEFVSSFPLKLKPVGRPDIDVLKGKVYVCEHDNQRVWIFDAKGELELEMSASYPAVLGVDGSGLVYLSGGGGVTQNRVVRRGKE